VLSFSRQRNEFSIVNIRDARIQADKLYWLIIGQCLIGASLA